MIAPSNYMATKERALEEEVSILNKSKEETLKEDLKSMQENE